MNCHACGADITTEEATCGNCGAVNPNSPAMYRPAPDSNPPVLEDTPVLVDTASQTVPAGSVTTP